MKRFGLILGVVLVVGGMAAAGAYRHFAQETGGAGDGRGGRGPTIVALTTVETRALADVLEALGTARSNEQVTITSRATDVISRVAFDSGQSVAAGDVLIEFADAEEAADLAEARATLDEVLLERDRVRELRQRDVIAQSQVDTAEAAVARARSRLDALTAAREDLVINAPFDGVIGLRNASPGMLVRPGDPIATLDDVSLIKVDFTVPERFLSVLTPGAPISLTADALDDVVFSGQVAQIDTRVDPVTRTVVVRAEIDNADGRLKPGMLMLVEVRRNERTAPVAPEIALVRRSEQAFVYVIEETERGLVARRRAVTPGLRVGGVVEIIDGLEQGEDIVADGVHRIRDGMPVRLAGQDRRGGRDEGEA